MHPWKAVLGETLVELGQWAQKHCVAVSEAQRHKINYQHTIYLHAREASNRFISYIEGKIRS